MVHAGDEEAAEEELLDLDGLASRVGVPVAILDSLVREGMLLPRTDGGEPRFGADDVDTLQAGLKLLEVGLPLPEVFALARRFHAMSREVAGEAVELFDTYVRKPLRETELDEAEKAERMVEAFAKLMPAVGTLVANHFRQILLQVAKEHFES